MPQKNRLPQFKPLPAGTPVARSSIPMRRGRPLVDLHDSAVRDAIAHELHQAVLEVTGTDGTGWCLLYTAAGEQLLNHLSGDASYFGQVGSLMLRPPDAGSNAGVFAMIVDHGGIDRHEFHAWIGHQVTGRAPDRAVAVQVDADQLEVIDFSARHYPTWWNLLAERQADFPVWTGPTPAYIWCVRNRLPSWLDVAANVVETLRSHEVLAATGMRDGSKTVAALAVSRLSYLW